MPKDDDINWLARSPQPAVEMHDREQRRMLKLMRRAGRSPFVRISRLFAFASFGFMIDAVAKQHWSTMLPAAMFAGFAAIFAGVPYARKMGMLPSEDPNQGHIGMGATIAPTATIEPGARVDMGATVGAGAIIRRGALVGMGATVAENAVIEAGASIGWGATVRDGAVVGEGALIGAGSTVESGAVVGAHMRIGPGGTVAAQPRDRSALPKTAASIAAPRPNVDSRDVRIDEICDKFETELKGTSARIDEFLRNPQETVVGVRRTCHDLLRRERELRKLADPEDQERLNRESTSLEQRIAAETDEITKRQLQGAVAAIDEQRKQRALLLRDANRLEAEQTRLVWTMEGLVSHMVRLRSTEISGASPELDRGLQQLRDDVAAVGGAMDHVRSLDLGIDPGPAELGEDSPEQSAVRQRVRG